MYIQKPKLHPLLQKVGFDPWMKNKIACNVSLDNNPEMWTFDTSIIMDKLKSFSALDD